MMAEHEVTGVDAPGRRIWRPGAAAILLLILGGSAGADGGADASADAGAAAAQDAVEVELDPVHRVVFENLSLRIIEADLAGGASTRFHRHRLDNLAVVLGDATVANQMQGQQTPPPPRELHAGELLFTQAADAPYVHRIVNAGTTAFRVIDIELKQPAGAFPALAALPAGLQADIGLDNAQLRVSTLHIASGTSTTKFRLGPGLLIALPGSEVEQVGAGGQSMSVAADGPRWHLRPGGIYELHNRSDHAATVIEVELK